MTIIILLLLLLVLLLLLLCWCCLYTVKIQVRFPSAHLSCLEHYVVCVSN